jgi:hypothetical protein
MAGYHLVEDRHVGAGSVPDVLAMDDVAVGTGASIVVAVAATIALVLTIVVAALSSALPAAASPAAPGARAPIMASIEGAGMALAPAAVAYRITDVAPARDGTYAIVGTAPERSDSLAPAVVGGLLLATLAATASVWRGAGTRVAGPRNRRPAAVDRPARGR